MAEDIKKTYPKPLLKFKWLSPYYSDSYLLIHVGRSLNKVDFHVSETT